MKISRSYLMGLGSGLILSALIAMVVPPVSINFAGDLPANQGIPSGNLPNSENQGNATSQDSSENSGMPEEGSLGNNSESNSESGKVTPDDSQSNSQPTKLFTIPSGSTADRIADLLIAEEWISSKEEFLDLVKEKNLASRFRAGSFELTEGMNPGEILEQLVP